MRRELRFIWLTLRRLYTRVLGIEEGTDIPATIEGIKRDISFRGHTAWILMFSILIASIGLNVNSTAVIIGAMLISPLMGPILGIGLAVGTQDNETLLRSLKNLGIAVSLSLITSTLYFTLTPLDIEQTELLARTRPTILDVLIALFGGFAGIIAGSRKEKSSVIPGVAIATALMPPLCTAGYGLASLKFHYFLGALYLFFINSVFISLSTFLVVRYLKFPLVEYVSELQRKRSRYILISLMIITIVPSSIIFYHVIQETRFKVNAERFIAEKCDFVESELLNYKLDYSSKLSTIELYYIGKRVSGEQKDYLQDQLAEYNLVPSRILPIADSIQLIIHQSGAVDQDLEEKFTEFNQELRANLLEEIYMQNQDLIQNKDKRIRFLENEMLRVSRRDTMPYEQLSREISFHFPAVEKFGFAQTIEITSPKDSLLRDTIPVFLIHMDENVNSSTRQQQMEDVTRWLRIRLNNPEVRTITY